MSAPVDAGTQFARIIMKACAYDPAQRYQTPEELYSALDDLKNGRSGRIRQLQNGVQKAGTDKTESYSAIAQNGRAAQNVTSDAENVRKSTVQNTRENKKTSDFQNAAKRKRGANNVPASSLTDKETMSVVAKQKIQPQETPSETVAIRSARAVEARKRRRRKKQLLRRALLAIVAGTAILMMAAVYYRVSTDHAREGQEYKTVASLDDERFSTTKSGSKDFSKVLDTIKVQATGYRDITVSAINILSGEDATQEVVMEAQDAPGDPIDTIVIDAHTLYGEYPPKIPESEIKTVEETGEIVLSRVVIPEYVVVHDGAPGDSTAPNYYVRYRDYIKNVASSEIYATWPDATIRANVLAIMSFTLNRVYTESVSYTHLTLPTSDLV